MTKVELQAAVVGILTSHNVDEVVVNEVRAFLEPKKGGLQVDIESITRKDEEGNVVEILCRASNLWLPATTEYFHKDDNSKVVNAEGVGLYIGYSKAADKIRKAHQKAMAASKDAIVNDMLEGNIDAENAKAQIAELQNLSPDYSTIVVSAE